MSMRVGPFSNPQAIDFINQYFVPVFVSNEDYRDGKVSEAENDLLVSIRRSAVKKGLSGGSVQVVLTTPEAEVIDVLHVAKAAQVRNLMRLLKRVTARQKTKPGKTLVAPTSTTKLPELKSDDLALHVKAQFHDKATSYVDDWVVLSPREWQQFVHSPVDAKRTEWSVDGELAKKILIHLYPYAADWDLHFDEIENANIDVRVLPGREPKTLAISGSIRRIQNRHPGATPEMLNVEIAGVAKIKANRPEITISTFKAQYGRRLFDGLVTSIAPEATNSVEPIK